MADDVYIAAPFGRILPRPMLSTSRKNSSDVQTFPSVSDKDAMLTRNLGFRDVPPFHMHNQGPQLPPLSQLLVKAEPLHPSMTMNPQPSSPRASHHRGLANSLPPSYHEAPRFERTAIPEPYHSHRLPDRHHDHNSHDMRNYPSNDFSFNYQRGLMPLPNRGGSLMPTYPRTHYDVGNDGAQGPSIINQPGRRVLSEEVVPGKGLCYIYEDGTACPKVVDGDSVNPQWGVTKAGKPRKRLAQACTTCREKKIKCDPSSPKCLQCQKFGRECRFEPFSRSSNQRSPEENSSPTSPTASNNATESPAPHRDSIASNDVSDCLSSHPAPSSKSSINLETLLSPGSLDNFPVDDPSNSRKPFKRMRHSASAPEMEADFSFRAPSSKRKYSDSPLSLSEGQELRIDFDPYEVEEKLTERYLDAYFVNVNKTTYCIFPRTAFMRWVRDCRSKSVWDRMLLYAMLAQGSVFTTDSRKLMHCSAFARIAHDTVSQCTGVLNLQVIQTRLILCMLNFAQGDTSKAWDFCGAAMRTACGLNYNTEEGVAASLEPAAYDFPNSMLIECRRRTFWSAYLMDRFNGFSSVHMSMIDNDDCLLRLPCSNDTYERGNIPKTPLFTSRLTDQPWDNRESGSTLGIMAFLIRGASIWGETIVQANRFRYFPKEGWETRYENFYQQTTEQLVAWEKSLDPHLKAHSENVDKAEETGYLGAYGVLHTIYHSTCMKLNRYARYDDMTPRRIARNVRVAHQHAQKTLELVSTLASQNRNRKSGPYDAPASSPFTGFAILAAVDILTATGSLTDMMNTKSRLKSLIAASIEMLEELSEHWKTAGGQLGLVNERYGNVLSTMSSSSSMKKVAFYVRQPLETGFGMEFDLVYGIPRIQYLDALDLGVQIHDDGELLEVRGTRSNSTNGTSERRQDDQGSSET